MAQIIQFPPRAAVEDEAPDIDLLTAVDAAIRDLRDIAALCGEETARLQAEECRRMLERAYELSV
jgi:hypothetical protein